MPSKVVSDEMLVSFTLTVLRCERYIISVISFNHLKQYLREEGDYACPKCFNADFDAMCLVSKSAHNYPRSSVFFLNVNMQVKRHASLNVFSNRYTCSMRP